MKRNKECLPWTRMFLATAVAMQLYFSNNVIAQTEPGVTPTALQLGTVAMNNGKVTVKLSEQVLEELKKHLSRSDYYVFLTPIGSGNIPLALAEKGDQAFTIETPLGPENTGKIIKIDYIIYVNRDLTSDPATPRTSATWKAEDKSTHFVKAGTGN